MRRQTAVVARRIGQHRLDWVFDRAFAHSAAGEQAFGSHMIAASAVFMVS